MNKEEKKTTHVFKVHTFLKPKQTFADSKMYRLFILLKISDTF